MEKLPNKESAKDQLSSLRDRKMILFEKDILGLHEEMVKHVNVVKKAYKEQGKDVREYKAYHMLIGSTVEGDNTQPFYDFPEPEYSVEKFIEKKEEEYGIKSAQG